MGCEEGAHLKENETQAKVHEGLKGNGKSERKKKSEDLQEEPSHD